MKLTDKQVNYLLQCESITQIKEFLTTKLQEIQKTIKKNEVQKQKNLVRSVEKLKKKQEKIEEQKRFLSSKADEYRKELIENQTEAEMVFKILLKEHNIKYEFQHILYSRGSFYIADFYIPKHHIIFELDGEYHFSKEQRARDKKRTSQIINEIGIKEVLRFKNSEVLNASSRKRTLNILKKYN